ncbi:FtsQ-type POTRA domain-containing protein [Paenibacillus sp. IB182496]|uniref:Cell division protein DivIB n=1 Tax=Paenibacillus sabuli TaxID=2772509 RepID=A0A927GSH2_9BACL|nr:FtsQ-type POTRA domain-containing protein [Paenibacillus sabuli]MBD2846286.1 FtsQ-type POTRA domain-containing protein [Paenibacillus sabuli]
MEQTIPALKKPQPKRRGNRKLLAVLVLLFIVLLAVLFFNSSISKISSVAVAGQQFLTKEELIDAAGVGIGDPFFSDSSNTIAARVEELHAVEEVEVTKHFPGDVQIRVREYPAVAYELDGQAELTAVLSNGTAIGLAGRDYIVDKPVLVGWEPEDPLKQKLSQTLSRLQAGLLSDFSEIIPIPSTSYPDRIKIYTRTQYEVVTAVSLLEEKADTLGALIETQEPGKVTMLLADTYTPFEQAGEEGESEDSNEKETTQ